VLDGDEVLWVTKKLARGLQWVEDDWRNTPHGDPW
jgi:hypothetical protein